MAESTEQPEAFPGLRAVVERMVVDETFKKALLENAEQAIKDYHFDVSPEEMVALTNLTPEDLEGLTPENLDERLSKSQYTIYTENIKGSAA